MRVSDIALIAKLPVSAMAAWCLPQSAWDRVAGAASDAAERLAPGPHRRRRRAIAAVLGAGGDASFDLTYRAYRRNIRVDQLHFMRSYRPGGWNARLRVEGRQHVVDAIAAGRGVILWVAPFVFSWLVTKRALAQAGLEVHHLSSATHGFSRTRFGIAFLNPIRTRIEDRYLAERITIPPDRPASTAVRAVGDRLRANRIVSITVAAEGARVLDVPFLAGRLRVATGATALALQTGAAVLPVFTVRTAVGEFVTVVEEPLAFSREGRRDAAMHGMAAQLAVRLGTHGRQWPDQLAWHLPCLGLEHAGGDTA